MYRIGIVAGEASGDLLGEALIHSLRKLAPDVEIEGIGGPCMERAGCRSLFPLERLSVMGLAEVVGRFRELYGIRKALASHFIRNPPHLFIGIDSPDFNLDLEYTLRSQGIGTVHYVSPHVWAWREYRLKKIRKAVDRILVLFPFEKDYYERHKIPVTYVGHPAADRIKMVPDRHAARSRLDIPEGRKVVAIMPGSREMELQRLLPPFLHTVQWCLQRRSDIHFVTSLLNEHSITRLKEEMKLNSLDGVPLSIFCRRADDVLEAADAALLASGTVTLEAMLYKLPMVVAYKMNPLSYHIINAMVRVRHAALPNLLAGTEIVPEYLQGRCRPDLLGHRILAWLDDNVGVENLRSTYSRLHDQLRLNAGDMAAASILETLQST